MTNWNPDLEAYTGPRYKALAQAIAESIRRGELKPGDKLPTHRALADQLGVTVGTVTRGYAEAEQRDLVTAKVGSGTFIKVHQQADSGFSLPTEEETTATDLSLSLPAPTRRAEALADSLRALSREPSLLYRLLEYPPEAGLLRHREMGSRWLQEKGVTATPERLILCNGGQHALSLAIRTLSRPGDTLVSEGLCFPGLIACTRQQRLRHIGVEFDDQGLIPEALEAACVRHQPKLLYCTPNLHNPTGAVLNQERRNRVIEICERHDLLIIEDNVQFCAQLPTETPLASMAPERVVHIDSVSKGLAGGLRVGFLLAPAGMEQTFIRTLRADCLTVPPLMAELVTRWIEGGEAAQLLEEMQAQMSVRHRIASQLLAGYSYQTQPGSFNLWLRLPEPWRAEAFRRRCAQDGILMKSTETFAVGGYPCPPAVRLCLSAPASTAALEKALSRVRQLLDELPPMDDHDLL